ncbi:MAG: hypothetical protein GY774_39520 [Planctomycetes bacterium]|nr:hypothetical protein [Planctomycetota bacterium]
MAIEFLPYVGPRSFERDDQAIFFGRDREVSDLLSLVIAHNEILLYAQSGAGKTSLLNAGLIPLMEKEGFEVLPIARVRGLIPKDSKLEDISNLYVFNALMSWAEDELDPGRLSRMSLVDFLKEQDHMLNEEGLTSPHVVIFDQFEELFTFYPERWKDREGFFRQVRDALEEDSLKRVLRVVFVVREEYIAQVDTFASLLPEKLRTRFHLECMRQEAALSAITAPLRDTRRSFADGVAERLVEELLRIRIETAPGKTAMAAGEFVEPVQLQAVCQSLWQHLPLDIIVITMDHLQAFGDVNQVLSEFYEESIERATQDSTIKDGDLREWFEAILITPAGTRGIVYKGEETTGGIPNAVVEVLESLYLIRSEWRAGARWYELTHDRFIEPIQESNRKWLSERWESVQTHRRLETKATEWVRLGSGSGGLLDEIELLEAEHLLASSEAEDMDKSGPLLALVHASKEAQSERLTQQRRIARFKLVAISTIGILIIAILGIGWWNAWQKTVYQAEGARQLSIQSLAVQAPHQHNQHQDELGALSARQGYLFNQKYKGHFNDQVDKALRAVLSGPYFSHILRGHKEGINSVAFSPDGHILASGSIDKTVVLWDLREPGAPPIVLQGYEENITSLFFSPDGRNLAAGSFEGNIWLWDRLQPEAAPAYIRGHRDQVWAVAFSPDGKTLASGSADSTVRLWDLHQPGSTPTILHGHEGDVKSMAFSPDGQMLATGSHDNTVRLWDLGQSSPDPTILNGHEGWVQSVAFSPDGKTLASGGADGTVRLWDLRQLSSTPTILDGHEGDVKSVTFSPDGQMLATGSDDNTVRLWDLGQSSPDPTILKGHGDWVLSVAFSPDRQRLASGSYDKTVRLWDLRQPEAAPTHLSSDETAIKSVAISPDGKMLASDGADGTVRLWNLRQPSSAPTILHEGNVKSVAFSPDGKMLASGSDDSTVRLWDLHRLGATPTVLRGHKGAIASITFSPDGRKLASGSFDKTVRLWNVLQPEMAPTILQVHGDWVWSVAFSADGHRLATGSTDKTVQLWDLRRPEAASTILHGHEGDVTSVAFSSDGFTLAAGGADKTVRLWDLRRLGATPIVLRGHKGAITSVAFSPDGHTLASGSFDKTVRLWDLNQPDIAPVVLSNHKGAITSVAFSPDGYRLASGSNDKTILIEIASTEMLAHMVCRKVRRNLTPDEWSQFVGAGIPYERTCPNLPILPGFIEAAGNRIMDDNVDGAIALFRRALELDPGLEIDPKREAIKLEARSLVDKGRLLVRQGKVNKAILSYKKAQKLDSTLKISAGSWNDLCWFGSLQGYAADIMHACEQAVALDIGNGSRFRDSRGLARALTANLKGAIDDFQAFIDWTNKEEQKSQRQHWIEVLRAGRTPFTPEEIKKLLNQ